MDESTMDESTMAEMTEQKTAADRLVKRVVRSLGRLK